MIYNFYFESFLIHGFYGGGKLMAGSGSPPFIECYDFIGLDLSSSHQCVLEVLEVLDK